MGLFIYLSIVIGANPANHAGYCWQTANSAVKRGKQTLLPEMARIRFGIRLATVIHA